MIRNDKYNIEKDIINQTLKNIAEIKNETENDNVYKISKYLFNLISFNYMTMDEYSDIRYNGVSLLMVAAFIKEHAIFVKLLVAGGDPHLKCTSGFYKDKSPFDLLSHEENSYLHEMISNHKNVMLTTEEYNNQYTPISIFKLTDDFYNAVNKSDKNLSDIRHIRQICITAARFLNDKNPSLIKSAEISEMNKTILDKPLVYYKYKYLLECCCLYDSSFKKSKIYLDFLKNDLNQYKFTNHAWLPDFSFTAISLPLQSNLGKGEPIFPVGLLLTMSVNAWLSDLNNHIKYFNTTEKKSAKLRIDQDGDLCFTRNSKLTKIENGNFIYVVTPKGGVIAINEEHGKHSTMRSGQPVISAGTIEIRNSKIVSISNNSGHMKTPKLNLLITVVYLNQNGYLDKECIINLNSNSNYNDYYLNLQALSNKNYIPLKVLLDDYKNIFLGDALKFIEEIYKIAPQKKYKIKV